MPDPAKKADEIFEEPDKKTPKKLDYKDLKKQKKAKILKIVLIVLAVLLIAGLAYWIWKYQINFDNNAGKASPSVLCPLTGMQTTQEKKDQRPIGIMIENHFDTRPQSGIKDAEMVYEAVAEGGITRYLAVYQCVSEEPIQIGPVRSARIYYVDWAKGLDALYAHVGGSPDGLDEIKKLEVSNLDQSYLSQYFWRTTDRVAPHNVYTTLAKLREAAKSKGYKTTGDLDGWKYKKSADKSSTSTTSETSTTGTAGTQLNVNFSNSPYNVVWKYSADKNVWLRYHDNSAHTDTIGQTQMSAKNIAVAFTKIDTRSDGRMDIITTGTGDALIYIDGKQIKGTWKKSTTSAMLKFYDSKGKEIEFNPGNTWIEFVQKTDQVVFK